MVTESKYPIYGDPSNRLHAIFKFKWTLKGGKAGEPKKDYMGEAGGLVSRIFGGIAYGLTHLQEINQSGPHSLDGGEVVISAGEYRFLSGWNGLLLMCLDGKCEFIHRMQNTEDHANVSELASVLGAKFDRAVKQEKPEKACDESCAVEPAKN